MSNVTLYQKAESLVLKQETEFAELAKIHGAVNFKKEASFALQILQGNSYTLGIAAKNPDSLKNAILNVASIGLSLSPVHKYAYLVPRKDSVCLDISYIGLVKLATDSGSIMWAVAELVRATDDFVFMGHGREPVHKFNPFSSGRGAIVGGYCLAKTHSGEFIVAMMPLDDIMKIRDRSESYKSGKSSPWKTDEEEMMKKTLIRRGSKSWPKTDTRDERFAKAIKDLEEDEIAGMRDVENAKESDVIDETPQKLTEIRDLLVVIDRSEERYLGHLERVHKRDLKSLEELSSAEIEQSLVELYGLAAKTKKTEVQNENA